MESGIAALDEKRRFAWKGKPRPGNRFQCAHATPAAVGPVLHRCNPGFSPASYGKPGRWGRGGSGSPSDRRRSRPARKGRCRLWRTMPAAAADIAGAPCTGTDASTMSCREGRVQPGGGRTSAAAPVRVPGLGEAAFRVVGRRRLPTAISRSKGHAGGLRVCHLL
jgi:hypothetical protein